MMVAEEILDTSLPSPEGPRRLPCMWYDYAGDPGCPTAATFVVVTADGELLATCCARHIGLFLITIRIAARAMLYEEWWAEQERSRKKASEG
jgi:hypothetical protein